MLYLQNVYKSFFIGFQNRIEYLLYNGIECSLSDDLNKFQIHKRFEKGNLNLKSSKYVEKGNGSEMLFSFRVSQLKIR